MSDQDNGKVSTLQRPTTDDPEAWKVYWKAQGWPWRTEPEIDAERQKYLAERRAIVPDIEKGIYPFKDIKLSRADVEWLLVTHENGRGPVDWSDESQRERIGLDLRGANLADIDLRELPLAKMRGGVNSQERQKITRPQRHLAAIHLERANLSVTHMEGAFLRNAHLEGANLEYIHLEHADCVATHFEGAYLGTAYLGSTYLRRAFFDEETFLDNLSLGNEQVGFSSLLDVNWGGVNLATIHWQQITMLGSERIARQKTTNEGQSKNTNTYLNEYGQAVRSYRQLSVILQSQGLNENAARFAYRAQLCQRIVLRIQKKFGQYLFSLVLDLLAGYGYRPGRSVLWYLVTIFGFTLAYFIFGHLPFFPDAFVFSLTSFHGRGFFPGLGSENSLHNPSVIMAAFEAVGGLLIEISFIATFTQRFFGR